jgi:hypothetical protein
MDQSEDEVPVATGRHSPPAHTPAAKAFLDLLQSTSRFPLLTNRPSSVKAGSRDLVASLSPPLPRTLLRAKDTHEASFADELVPANLNEKFDESTQVTSPSPQGVLAFAVQLAWAIHTHQSPPAALALVPYTGTPGEAASDPTPAETIRRDDSGRQEETRSDRTTVEHIPAADSGIQEDEAMWDPTTVETTAGHDSAIQGEPTSDPTTMVKTPAADAETQGEPNSDSYNLEATLGGLSTGGAHNPNWSVEAHSDGEESQDSYWRYRETFYDYEEVDDNGELVEKSGFAGTAEVFLEGRIDQTEASKLVQERGDLNISSHKAASPQEGMSRVYFRDSAAKASQGPDRPSIPDDSAHPDADTDKKRKSRDKKRKDKKRRKKEKRESSKTSEEPEQNGDTKLSKALLQRWKKRDEELEKTRETLSRKRPQLQAESNRPDKASRGLVAQSEPRPDTLRASSSRFTAILPGSVAVPLQQQQQQQHAGSTKFERQAALQQNSYKMDHEAKSEPPRIRDHLPGTAKHIGPPRALLMRKSKPGVPIQHLYGTGVKISGTNKSNFVVAPRQNQADSTNVATKEVTRERMLFERSFSRQENVFGSRETNHAAVAALQMPSTKRSGATKTPVDRASVPQSVAHGHPDERRDSEAARSSQTERYPLRSNEHLNVAASKRNALTGGEGTTGYLSSSKSHHPNQRLLARNSIDDSWSNAPNQQLPERSNTGIAHRPSGELRSRQSEIPYDMQQAPIRHFCSEQFLEKWPTIVGKLASGHWENQGTRNNPPQPRSAIELIDTPLVDQCGVDIELSSRSAVLLCPLSELLNPSACKERVLSIARLVSIERYSHLFLVLLLDVSSTAAASQACILKLHTATIIRGSAPPVSTHIRASKPMALAESFAEIILNHQGCNSSRSTSIPDIHGVALERAHLLLSLVPSLSVRGALKCMELADELAPGGGMAFGDLFGSERLRQQISLRATSHPSRAPDVHPAAMLQLSHVARSSVDRTALPKG